MANKFDTRVDSLLSGFMENEYASASLYLFLILYAGVIAPKLPASALSMFNNWFVQILMFFAIVYISKKNATVALIVAIAIWSTLIIANNKVITDNLTAIINSEKFCSACGDNNKQTGLSPSMYTNSEPSEGRVMSSDDELEYPNAFENQSMCNRRTTDLNVTGIKQSEMENEVVGSSLDDTMTLGSENALC